MRPHMSSRLSATLLLTHLAAALCASGAALSFAKGGPGSVVGWILVFAASALLVYGVGTLERTVATVKRLTHLVESLEEGAPTARSSCRLTKRRRGWRRLLIAWGPGSAGGSSNSPTSGPRWKPSCKASPIR